MFMYAAGRRLAHKWKTELKLDTSEYADYRLRSYSLDKFNISASIATQQEVESLKKLREGTGLGTEISKPRWQYMPEVLNWPDNLYLFGAWEDERYFADIADIIRQEFTLKNPLGAVSQFWREKILATDCAVSLHVRHGDFVYKPEHSMLPGFAVLPLDYYYECIHQLRQHCGSFKIFVFSNNINWCKENFRFDLPIEFVEGCESDAEEIYLMSLCKHNIIANSTFSWWGAWLNQNPGKKVFMPIPANYVSGMEYRYSPTTIENSPLESDHWIRVPFELGNPPPITIRPYFSLLLVVNNNIATVAETLKSILLQKYKFYELIIIDNASTDGSGKICREVAKEMDDVTFIKLYDKISDGAAWNKALSIAQGDFVIFLRGGDMILDDTLISLYTLNEYLRLEVVNSVFWFQEDSQGTITFADKKFSIQKDLSLGSIKRDLIMKVDKFLDPKILSGNASCVPLSSKVFKRKFLLDNTIRFNERINNAEIFFMTEAMFKAGELLFTLKPFYVRRNSNS